MAVGRTPLKSLTVIILMSMDPRISSFPDLASLPTRRLRWLASAARLLLGLVLAFWLLLGASWSFLHGWIVPRIGDFRPRLESVAGKALGMPVRIGQISAESNGLIPSFDLRDVVLLDALGREALRLPQLKASLSPSSLWGMGFEQLSIERPVLEVRRASDGRIYVGGIDISQTHNNGNAAADWFFSQAEFSIKGGSIRWIDEQRQAPVLELTGVDAVMRNGRRRHLMRLDATPPPEWGARFSVRGIFRQPFLSTAAGRWSDWSGQLFADFSRVDASRIRQYVDLGAFNLDLAAGNGALRAWADLKAGEITGGTADLALVDVNAQLGKELKPLAMESIAGRLNARKINNGFEFDTRDMLFRTREGLQWPGGNVALTYRYPLGDQGQQLDFKADRLDLAALAQIANRLPLGTSTHGLITSFAPKGLVETVDARWRGPWDAPQSYSARGRVSGLELAALASPAASVVKGTQSHAHPGRPGISGASIDFDLSQTGGKAGISITAGALDLPGIFEDSRVPFDKLAMDAQWKLQAGKSDLQLRNIRFASADAEGIAQAAWLSGEAAAGTRAAVNPMGVLDLQGSLSRGNGARVHRYLPLVLPDTVRHYVRDAVVKGNLSEVKFKVKGAVDKIPFSDPTQGEFRISARVKNALFAYVPVSIQPKDALPWPALNELEGELVFNRAALEVNGAKARFLGLPGLQILKADARIPDLLHSATVEIGGNLRGPAADALGFVNNSPLAAITGRVLAQASASGAADYALQLNLPLANLEKSRVRGTVTLPGNDVQLCPAVPALGRLKGVATFSETGFTVLGADAKFLGGDVRFEGGSRQPPRPGAPTADNNETLAFRAQGSLTAEGLRQFGESTDSGVVAQLGRAASGSTAYSASLAVRKGVAEVAFSSNLQGMGLSLPAPLRKTPEATLPLRFEHALVPESMATGQRLQDRISLTIGNLASVIYVRDISAADARVVSGAIGVGLEAGESAPLPDSGVVANINLGTLDLDAWDRVLATSPDSAAAPPGRGTARSSSAAAVSAYLPNRMAIRARELTVEGYKLNRVVVGGTREGSNWRANIDSEELNGYVEFSQAGAASAGRVYARLARISLGAATASEVESLLDEPPASIPALDIIVDDFELRGRKLGRVEIAAVNRGAFSGAREWRLNKFNVTLPEAVLTATGNWVALNAQAPVAAAARASSRGRTEARRTAMTFKLDILDSGELLKRFGMNDVIRRGRGKLEGDVAWIGSPLSLDYPTMNGQFNVNIESGQFLKAEPGIAKLLGVLSLQALPRRLTLDFRDVFSAGFAFDFVRGDVNISQGVASTNNLQMKGVNAAVLMDGSADIARETQDLKVVVVPEINAGTASLIATVINPAIGLGTFLAQYFLRQPLIRANTQEFHIDGSWADPKITKVERTK